MELSEERSLLTDSDDCAQASSNLINPRKRLSAEIAWLPGVSPKNTNAVVQWLSKPVRSLHPLDPLDKARHRSWIAFASSTLDNIAGFYSAPEQAAWERQRRSLVSKFKQLQSTLPSGPYFSGTAFSLADAAFAPVFRYFEVFEGIGDFGFFGATPAVSAWRSALAGRSSVKAAAVDDYHDRLLKFLARRGSHLSTLLEATQAA